MNTDVEAIRNYLRPASDSFWKWTEDGEAIVWKDDRTIAFRQEVVAVLSRLRSNELPPFASIVMLLAACRNSWPKTEEQLAVLQGTTWDWLHEYPDKLGSIHDLPPSLRNHTSVKAELAAMLFESIPAAALASFQNATSVAQTLKNGFAADLLTDEDRAPGPNHKSITGLEALVHGLETVHVDADALRLRMETSLEQDVLPVESGSPPAKSIRELLEELRNDEELAGMVRLARNLLAVVSLPRPLADRDEMPIGGVSDISNRGTLDRLLISELAQDDDTLMMRVAMREALYLRRETPPRNPPRSRRIIVDAGIRLWGVPRVFATSVALSLLAMSDPEGHVNVFRPDGDKLRPVDFTTRDGLMEHLHALCPEIHPGSALRSLSEPDEPDTDTILITAEDVASDPEFQQALSSLPVPIPFLMTISRDGRFQIFERTPFGTKRIREATLSLDELLAPTEKPRLPLVDEKLKRSEDLPAIWKVTPFPLRLSHHIRPENTWRVRNYGVLSITNDRRLVRWDRPLLGGRQLADNLPSRRLHWCRLFAENGVTQCVIGDPGQSKLWLVTIDLDTDLVAVTVLLTTQTAVRGVCEYTGVLFVIYGNSVSAHSLVDARSLTKVELPSPLRWLNGRYFIGRKSYFAVFYDGDQIWFETILDFKDLPPTPEAHLVRIFDVEGESGPFGLMLKPAIFRIADRHRFPLSKPLKPVREVKRISHDGRRLLVNTGTSRHRGDAKLWIVNTRNQEVSRCGSDPGFSLDPDIRQVVRQRDVRKKFHAIGLLTEQRKSENGLFMLFGSSGPMVLGFLRKETTKLIIRKYHGLTVPDGRDAFFRPHDTPQDVRIRLKFASFSDGSQVFLDSRGLLHLRSSDRSIPEATIVLTDFELAGWSSDGRMWGPRYYLGHHSATDPEIIVKEILRPFVKRIVG
ncbi:hypothetical protein [Thalassoroseus pseudoceratinae]|uniref:hypothetical protein n=1 Tax=Thalassoroseus pseudoceratinae TaxID=2713176 RepID=UPI00142030A4|nr:hypothetical protein [Thalassoroseus pseudoceratinae]